jgi:hypothetical protein
MRQFGLPGRWFRSRRGRSTIFSVPKGRFESADEALARGSRDPDGSMTWGSVGRGDEAFWGTLGRGWVGILALAVALAAIVVLLVWLFW